MHQKYILLSRIPKQKFSRIIANKILWKYKIRSSKPKRIISIITKEETAKNMKAINMVTILVFDGVGKEDLDKFLRQFKRVCMANGNRDERAQYN
jgi:hypothetical protein